MSFDEIFPEQPFPDPTKNSPYGSSGLTDNNTTHQKYDPNCGNDTHYPDLNDPSLGGTDSDFTPNAYQYNNQSGDSPTILPKVSNYTRPQNPNLNPNIPGYGRQPNPESNFSYNLKSVILILFGMSPFMGGIPALLCFISSIREIKKSAKKGLTSSSTAATFLAISAIQLLIHICTFIQMIIS